MSLKREIKAVPLLLMLFVWMAGAGSRAIAQTDSTAASNTMASDSATAGQDTAAAASPTRISTDIDTSLLSWTGGGPGAPQPERNLTAEYKSIWYYFFLFLLFCLFIGIVGKALRLYELTKNLQGKETGINWNRVQGMLFGLALIIGIYGAYWSYTVQGPMSVTESATIHGKKLDTMFNVTLIVTTIVFILTHILLFGFSYVYSGSAKRKAYFYPHNNTVERLWTIIPAFVLAGLVLFGFFTWRNITEIPESEQKKAITLEVTGEQFTWNIRYGGVDNQLGLRNYKLTTPINVLGIDFTDRKSWDDRLGGEIVLPVNRPVRVAINSKDILHSFYIPDFKAQINAVPGMTTYFHFTPIYTTKQMRDKRKDPNFNYILLCAKICGQGHYNMQKKVTVVSEQEYREWLAQQPLYYNDDVKKSMQSAAKQGAPGKNKIALNN